MTQPNRLANGGRINRNQPIEFKFDNKTYQGYAGDTLASALLANDVLLMGRSFKYHRPRGVITAGSMEPNALVELGEGDYHEPNTRATMIPLYEGLVASSQNRWPSLQFDVMSVNRLLSPVFAAGFYYKTFMWPGLKGWMWYEKVIRNAAGLGTAPKGTDPDRYQKSHLFCDVLIVGGGVSGLTAAVYQASLGHKVILMDEMPTLGGRTNSGLNRQQSEQKDALIAHVYNNPSICAFTDCTVFGAYDHGVFGAVELLNGRDDVDGGNKYCQRYHKILADKVVYATGATERTLLFKNNDLPGVMLAEALQRYVIEYAVLPAKNIVFYTTNDSIYPFAKYLISSGIAAVDIVDSRATSPAIEEAKKLGINVYTEGRIQKALGGKRVKSVLIDYMTDHVKNTRQIDCGVVAMSGGFTPNVNLQCHLGNRPHYDEITDSLIIDDKQGLTIGSAAGIWAFADKLKSAATDNDKDVAALRSNSFHQDKSNQAFDIPEKAFVDYQHDVTNFDVQLASRENYTSVEHTKRYTTLGMATDQGKLANFNSLKIMALAQQKPITEIGTTTYRPPYTPVTLGALVGAKRFDKTKPTRRIPTHQLHEKAGAKFTPVGLWQRPEFYPQNSTDTKASAYIREAKMVRQSVGMIDVSTLGKIAVQGPDAAEFLNRLYINGMKKLGIGKIRYGLMLREDGIPYDDGTVMRVSANEFLVTTTTAHAADVLRHMEYHLQVIWPELQVFVTSATDQWASIAVAGPNSRATLANLFGKDIDLSNKSLPFMTFKDFIHNGITIRLARISFSGELGYEVMIGAKYATALWESIEQAGKDFNIGAYGTEAMGALRIEKGFITHSEMDGRVNIHQLGMSNMMSQLKDDFIGKYYAENRLTDINGQAQLIGLVCVDATQKLSPGYHLVANDTTAPTKSLGWVTSTTWSVATNQFIALGFLQDGLQKMGQTIYATSPVDNKTVAVKVVNSQFFDPTGEVSNG